MYIITIAYNGIGRCSSTEATLTTVTPTGTLTHTCIDKYIEYGGLISLNQELNSIISQGYKLIETNNGFANQNGTINSTELNYGTIYYFAIP